jgi:hypothetical protein
MKDTKKPQKVWQWSTLANGNFFFRLSVFSVSFKEYIIAFVRRKQISNL